jgi:hypothetical protein
MPVACQSAHDSSLPPSGARRRLTFRSTPGGGLTTLPSNWHCLKASWSVLYEYSNCPLCQPSLFLSRSHLPPSAV